MGEILRVEVYLGHFRLFNCWIILKIPKFIAFFMQNRLLENYFILFQKCPFQK
jgi:hypothetical protein